MNNIMPKKRAAARGNGGSDTYEIAAQGRLLYTVTTYCKVHAHTAEASEVEKAKAHTAMMRALLDWFEHCSSVSQHRAAKPFIDAFLAANTEHITKPRKQ